MNVTLAQRTPQRVRRAGQDHDLRRLWWSASVIPSDYLSFRAFTSQPSEAGDDSPYVRLLKQYRTTSPQPTVCPDEFISIPHRSEEGAWARETKRMLAGSHLLGRLAMSALGTTAESKHESSIPPVPHPVLTTVPQNILDELATVQDEAKEEGFPVPSETLVEDVGKLLVKLYHIAPLPYTIYPMEKGEIAIDARQEPTGAVVLLCHERDTWCVVSIGNKSCRAWSRDRNEPPEAFEEFIKSALTTLAFSKAR